MNTPKHFTLWNLKTAKEKKVLEHISQLGVPFLFPEDRQSVCSIHDTPLSDHIRHKQPEMKQYGDYRDKKPPSLSRDAERIVHPHVLNTNLSPSVTAPFITHKANPVSGTMPPIRPSSPLSDSIEMNIRTTGYILKWFVFPPPTEANFHRLINLGIILPHKEDVSLFSLKHYELPRVAVRDDGQFVSLN